MSRKKISFGGLASVVAGILFAVVMPLLAMAPTYAAATCTWQDQNSMTCGSESFGNGKITGNTTKGDVVTMTGNTATAGSKNCPTDTAVWNPFLGKVVETTYTGSANGSCKQTTANLTATNTANSVKTCSDGSPPDSSGNCPAASGSSCGGGNWDWAICPTDTLFQTMVKGLTDFYENQLTIQTSTIFGGDTGNAYYRAWNSFRILGTALMVVAGLVMVASQALGFEILDAYTIRKILPRLLVAIIGMSLSWPLLNFVINFFNTLGHDIRYLMYAPFSTLPNHAGLSDGIVSWGLIAAFTGLMAKGYGGTLLPIMGTGALAMLIGILIIIIRQIGVVLLVIVAPLAIASYVLPNTKKLWDLWKDNFLGLMVMFPIVMAFIAAGQIFSQVGKSGNFVQQLVGIVAYFVPFFLIPLAFRMATGLISTITGFVNDRSKGGFDRMKNARQNAAHHANEHNKKQLTAWRNDKYTKLQSKGGLHRRAMARVIGGRDMYQTHAGQQAAAKKQADELVSNGIDDELRALTARQGADGKYYSLAGKEVSEAAVKRAKSRWGHDVYMQQEALSYEMRKATSEDEIRSVQDGYVDVAKNQWHMSDGQATGAWVGGAFANQNKHLEYKNMRMEKDGGGNLTGRMTMESGKAGAGTAGFVDETFENRGSYNMASMGSNTIRELSDAYKQHDLVLNGRDAAGNVATYSADQVSLAQEQQMKIKAIAQTFMHEGFGGGTVGRTDTDQPVDVGGGGGGRRAATPGAGHVAQRVVELAELTGAMAAEPSGPAPNDGQQGQTQFRP